MNTAKQEYIINLIAKMIPFFVIIVLGLIAVIGFNTEKYW